MGSPGSASDGSTNLLSRFWGSHARCWSCALARSNRHRQYPPEYCCVSDFISDLTAAHRKQSFAHCRHLFNCFFACLCDYLGRIFLRSCLPAPTADNSLFWDPGNPAEDRSLESSVCLHTCRCVLHRLQVYWVDANCRICHGDYP